MAKTMPPNSGVSCRICVTGMGVVSPAGYTLDNFWDFLYGKNISYEPAEELIEREDMRIKVASKIKNDNWASYVPEHIISSYGKASAYTVSAVISALNDAGLNLSYSHARIAVVMGTTMGEIETEEKITENIAKGNDFDKTLYYKYITHNISRSVEDILGKKCMLYTVPSACAAGNYAVGIAKNLLDWDVADIVIAGGVDVFSYVAFSGFQRLLSLTPDLCRPFDKNRKGLVVGEGCGVIVMERENERHGHKSYGYILGAGFASNAYHMTAPHVDGQGEKTAMINALISAGLHIGDIGYISAHGTGTKLNDKTEALAVNSLFGQNNPYISSIKSMLGHSMGAASILELIASFLMLKHKIILPNVNYETPDSACALVNIPTDPVTADIRYIMSNSFAFGGQTSSVVIGEPSHG